MTPRAFLQVFCFSVIFYTSISDARVSRVRRAGAVDNCPTPPAPGNGTVLCEAADQLALDIFCTFECNQGYTFEGITDPSIIFICDVSSGFYSTPVTPPCIPECNPPCLHGGKCVAPNTCQCVAPYYGSQCVHSRQLCDDPTPGRFGKMECQPDGSGGKVCVPVCLPTFKFETPPPAQYVCGKDGTWTPDVNQIPDCIEEIKAVTTTTPQPVTVARISGQAICSAWGINHFRTFDSRVYSFDGNCRYVLARSANAFEIFLVNDPTCARPGTCPRAVEAFQNGNEISLHDSGNGPEVTWNGQVIPVPAFKDGIIFQKLGNYMTLRSTLGYSIKWDGKQSVFIQASEDFKGSIQGLCGKYNGDRTDDFETESGQQLTDVGDFGSSWKKTRAGDVCPDAQQTGGCSAQSIAVTQDADMKCDTILSDSAFIPCHQKVDPAPYIESCKSDCCSTPGSGSCMCDAMEAYSRACLDKQVKLSWRAQGRCEMTCNNGMIYKECGSTCPQDCSSANTVCTDPTCIDGCFCPDGQVLSNGQCIPSDQCPCEHSGKQFTQGDVINQQCNTCTCKAGTWDCTHKACEKTCSATGDPHYETFDGKRYNFMGTCSYYLMKDRDFSVITDNIQCGHGEASCTKSISIDMNGLNIKLDHNHQLFINGREITQLPYDAPGIKVSMVSSLFMQAVLSNGVTILWDGRTRAYIKAPATFMGKTIGMCGTFDGNQANDFKTLSGTIETNPNAFGNQWKTSTSCRNMPTTVEPDPCDVNPQKKAQATTLCDQLKSDIFKACHSVEDVTPYYDDCVYDLCACSDNMKDCMCPNIGSYADTCASKGININWRLQITECMLSCPGGQEYQVCGRPCERTCRDIAENTDDFCDAKCVEGCNCPDGQTQNNEGQCVTISSCPCIFDGREYPPGYTTLKGTEICVCEGGRFKCSKISFSNGNTLKTTDPLCPNNTVYSECLSNCPKTCENKYSPPTCDNSTCKAGCECISGYLFDGDKCVEENMCPCHHAGKAYYEGESYIQDCNECKCVGHQWQCTQNDCPATCKAYGDSHYTTFDGVPYEFQGACDYVLVQSIQGSPYKFMISTRNSQCGTSGVTCFKQLDFVVGEEGTDSFYRLQLIRGQSVVPEPGSPFTVKEVGDMVYITTPFGITLQWDKQTRIYVRLSTDHMQLVEGLCGNFNRDPTDDFTAQQGGLVQPTLFGDSWRVDKSCAPSQEIKDTCVSNPQRARWAQEKCSILNSDLFEPCHKFVDVAQYVSRCEFDACACDLGGDCECLCTAIAAYAHECAVAGVSILWRTNDLCPLQCEDCETFNPCMSLCPKKTCENRLIYNQIEKDCEDSKGVCFEGCDLQPCADGQVFDSLLKPVTCIPETLCETTACEINGKKYREGGRVDDPMVCRTECEICICRSGLLEHITFGQCDPLPYNGKTPTPSPSQTVSSPNQPGKQTTDKGATPPPYNTITSKGIFGN